jgi:tyrosyl-tRNA synthetase
MPFKSDFLRVLDERGFIHQISDPEGLDDRVMQGPITAYIGFDCTARSLHIGSMLPIMMLHWLQQTGNKPIALMGGGTTKVGDPSGKDEARKLLTDADIAANMAGIQQVFAKFLRFGDGKTDAMMVNNAEWLDELNYIAFLRDYGPHFTINRMMTFDSVKLRLEREQPLTFLEFNYMILQAYDFVELSRRYACELQMGGSDQWGNIINGMELGRRVGEKQMYALTAPLLTTSSGAKMGKTAAGAVWLNADMLSPYDYWQYWRNTEDADVERFLKLFTTLPLDEIARLAALKGAEVNEAKKVLANEATSLLHGADAARAAADTAQKTFDEGGAGEDLPIVELTKGSFQRSRSVGVILMASGLFSSKSDMRRKVAGGGVKINDKLVTDTAAFIPYSNNDITTGAYKVQFGKKQFVLVKPV